MSSLNQKMIDLATAIRTKRGLANNNLLSLDEMIEQIYLLEHDFYKQAVTGTTTYTAMSIDLKTLAPYAFYGL
jgi:hypothetical protein